jgi:D-3-phosphoglycerate dehydrogenase
MEVGRHHRGGEAIMVVNVDDPIPDGALEEIQAIPGLERVYRVSLPPAQPRVALMREALTLAD